MKIQWTLIFTLIFALVVAIFAVVNVEPVPVNFIFAKTQLPLILVILGSTLIGGVIVGLFGIVRQYKLQREIKALHKQIEGEKSSKPVKLVETVEASKSNHSGDLTPITSSPVPTSAPEESAGNK